ncbi:uncharacterized protein LOC105282617 [Ooceraea biroi]|nr:uncharacterized protein LOC105282617 [Ooceraea biroi]
MMICIKKRFFNWNRFLLLLFGLWPYKETIFTNLLGTLVCNYLMSIIVVLLLRFYFVECSFDFVVKMLCGVTFYAILAIPPITMWMKTKDVRYLLDQLQHIYNQLKDKDEIAIYDKYGYIAKRMTIRIIILIMSGLYFIGVMVYWPYTFDIIMPKNESYATRIMEFVTEYFVVQEQFHFFLILHLSTVSFTGSVLTTAVGTMIISYFKHICGMFEIASYRIEKAMAIELLHNFDMKNGIVICRKIICAVDIQRQAMEFATASVNSLEGSVLALVIIIVLCMSLNLLRIFQIESPAERIEEVLLHLSVVIIIMCSTLLANNSGQEVTDYSNHVYVTIYNVPWYLAPVNIQKLILFLLQRSSKIFTLNISGIFVASLKCFATLINASMSYFTFMYSVQ